MNEFKIFTLIKMYLDKHITKNYFFDVFEKRLKEYEEAIFGNKKMPGMKLHLVTVWLHHIQELEKNDTSFNLFGDSFWGYGINNICNGSDEYNNPDVFEVKKIGGLNKHHENYRYLFLLLFKIENNSFFVSTFIIDPCGYKHVSKINKKYDLKDFKSHQIIKHGNSIIIELFFDSLDKPIRFQIDTYHFGGYNLSGQNLAKYYTDEITKLYNSLPSLKEEKMKPRVFDFIPDFIDGIKLLQNQDINAECIRKIREDNKRDESAFRYWFQLCFTMKGYNAEPEPEKGNGRIDLKVTHSTISNKVIEFKGWWNNDKNEIIIQVCSYLTEFEGDAYIFMINHTKSDITDRYKEIICSEEMKYVRNSWEEVPHKPSDYFYFKSRHDISRKGKNVYHFIFPVYV